MTDTPAAPAAPAPDPDPGDSPAPRSLFARLAARFASRPGSARSDLAEVLQSASNGEGDLSENERAILQNVLQLGDMRVDDVMVPRADIEAVDIDDTMGELIAAFHEAGHSRLPVFEDNLDSITGMVHIKDALKALTQVTKTADGPPVKLLAPVLRQKIGRLDMVRPVLFVPPSMPVGDLLQQMQATRAHMAIVVDEYGGTDGLVTIEDLLEAVVGDIEDEHDDADTALVKRIEDNIFVADARAELSELQAVIGPDFQPGQMVEDVDTLGGLIFDLIDRVPVRGEVVSVMKGFEFEILAADARRIKRVRIVRRKRAPRPRPPRVEPAAPPAIEAAQPVAGAGEDTGTA